jgi:hypothetical protein
MEYLEGFNKNKIKAQKIVQNIVDLLPRILEKSLMDLIL